jgi:hypothetical protein
MNLLCVGGPRGGRIVSDNGPVYKFHADQVLSELEAGDGLVVMVSSYRYVKQRFHYNRQDADVYFWEHSNPKEGMELIMDALSNLGETK